MCNTLSACGAMSAIKCATARGARSTAAKSTIDNPLSSKRKGISAPPPNLFEINSGVFPGTISTLTHLAPLAGRSKACFADSVPLLPKRKVMSDLTFRASLRQSAGSPWIISRTLSEPTTVRLAPVSKTPSAPVVTAKIEYSPQVPGATVLQASGYSYPCLCLALCQPPSQPAKAVRLLSPI